MKFRLAELPDVDAVRAFFKRSLPRGSDGVYNEEFYCPLGVKAAVQRRQMLLAVDDQQRIVGAARFYPKKNGEFSLYQFAVDPAYRGHRLSCAMLDAVRGGRAMRSMCPPSAAFNAYYRSCGWRLEGVAHDLNQWVLDPSEIEDQPA